MTPCNQSPEWTLCYQEEGRLLKTVYTWFQSAHAQWPSPVTAARLPKDQLWACHRLYWHTGGVPFLSHHSRQHTLPEASVYSAEERLPLPVSVGTELVLRGPQGTGQLAALPGHSELRGAGEGLGRPGNQGRSDLPASLDFDWNLG